MERTCFLSALQWKTTQKKIPSSFSHISVISSSYLPLLLQWWTWKDLNRLSCCYLFKFSYKAIQHGYSLNVLQQKECKKRHYSVNGWYIGALLRRNLHIFYAQKTGEGREGHTVGIGTFLWRSSVGVFQPEREWPCLALFQQWRVLSMPTTQTDCLDPRTPHVWDRARIIKPDDLKTSSFKF